MKKQMHCVMFFGTNDYAWIEEVNMKDYAQFKSTFVKPKQSKAIGNAIDEIEKYCKGRGESTAPTGGGGGEGMSDEDDEEEFDQLISGTPTSTKAVKKASRKRDALEGGADSDSSASGPSSTSASAKKAKMGRPQLKMKTEEPSSTHRLVGWSRLCCSLKERSFCPPLDLYFALTPQFTVKGRADQKARCTHQP